MRTRVPVQEGSGPPVRVEVLGPLRLVRGEQVVEVPGPKRRALLALLARAQGRAVPVDELLEGLWPEGLPGSARTTLQSHISRLRGHLGPSADRLQSLAGGYRLQLDDTDVARARALLAAAGAATAAGGAGGDPAEARRCLEQAWALWRGEPLAEFTDVPPLMAWAVSLDELRQAVDEAHAAAALATGATGEALELATRLVTAAPHSEAAVVLLMRALHARGRAAEALRIGYDFRRRLATETGLEATAALAELERAIAGSSSTPAGDVPRPASPLRGRDSELAALHRLVARERLVTVLGPGGVGKTRLAVEIAARAERSTALLLSPVTDPGALPHALAAALGLQVRHGEVVRSCAALLAAGPHLLLVDNCEHLLPGVRELVTGLLDACPELTVLATSREPLGVPVEQRLRISPLPLSLPRDLDDLARSPAVAVFIDRARRVRPGFSPSEPDLRVIAQIVRRLDGMPLAIELAACRLSSFGPADILARLDRSLDLLRDSRDGTLRQAIEWSYDLLPDDERRLFRNLGVYPDGFDLATADIVAAACGPTGDAAIALGHLVDASMIEADLTPEPRYRMLDTMRSFARDRLDAEGESDTAHERFLAWALDLVAWVDKMIDTDQEALADRVLRRELVNLRAAWRWIRARARIDDAVRVVLGLGLAAGWRDLTEVWGWTLELADDPALAGHPQAGSVLGLAAGSAWSRGEPDRAEELARRGLASPGEGGWWSKTALALVALSRGDLPGAVAHGTASAAQAPRTDGSLGVAALALAYQGNLDEAAALNTRWARTLLSPTLEGFHHYVAGEIDALAGRSTAAEERYRRAIALATDSGATFVRGIASVGFVSICADAGRIGEALDGYRSLLDYWERTDGWVQAWTTLRNLARLLRSLGDEDTATLLETAADTAPESPVVIDDAGEGRRLPAGRGARTGARPATPDRARVLDAARRAIEAHRDAAARGLVHPDAQPAARRPV